MATVNDLIIDAYGEIGTYGPADTMSTADSGFALRRLNMILDTWSAQPLMSMALRFLDLPVVAGTDSYTIGPSGATVTAPRVTRIRSARLSYPNSNPLFYPLDVLSILDYEYLKARRYYDLTTRPDTVVLQNSLPNSTILVSPKPDQDCTIRIWADYPQFTAANLTDVLTLSGGVYKALMLQLAMELAPSFGATVSPVTQMAWQDAMRTVKAMNTIQQGTPYDERSPGMGGRFDIRSGLEYWS
jgi:hypothetical protein